MLSCQEITFFESRYCINKTFFVCGVLLLVWLGAIVKTRDNLFLLIFIRKSPLRIIHTKNALLVSMSQNMTLQCIVSKTIYMFPYCKCFYLMLAIQKLVYTKSIATRSESKTNYRRS